MQSKVNSPIAASLEKTESMAQIVDLIDKAVRDRTKTNPAAALHSVGGQQLNGNKIVITNSSFHKMTLWILSQKA